MARFTWIKAGKGSGVKAWMEGVPFDSNTLDQLKRTARLPFIYKYVAAMPDAHFGLGSTVGSVIPTQGAIVPASVGVDLGCGMMACRTGYVAEDLDRLPVLRREIERAVPHGRTNHGGPGDRGAWGSPPARVVRRAQRLLPGLTEVLEKHPRIDRRGSLRDRAARQLGTLGGGNHFIEVCLDRDSRVWAMLHSGSRGVGNAIGQYFIARAKDEMRRWHIRIPDADLAYLAEGSTYFDDYVRAVSWAQGYAWANREVMMREVLDALDRIVGRGERRPPDMTVVHCHHNYVAKEHHFGKNVWVTRKGAVRARAGDMGIIPGSMGAKSYIVRGKGCADSFHSCSHGAGRAMSRTTAKRAFTEEDHARATAGVECRKDAGVLDETPGAYKPIDAVMRAQQDLVSVVHTLKQVVCVKG